MFARSAGTAWERYLTASSVLKCGAPPRYVREMREHGIGVVEPTPEMSRIPAGIFFRGYFEPLLLGLSREGGFHAFVADFERFFQRRLRDDHEPPAVVILGSPRCFRETSVPLHDGGCALAQRDARAQRTCSRNGARARSPFLPLVILAESLHRAPVRPLHGPYRGEKVVTMLYNGVILLRM